MDNLKKTFVALAAALIVAGTVYFLAVQPESPPSTSRTLSGTASEPLSNTIGEIAKSDNSSETIPGMVEKTGNPKISDAATALDCCGMISGRVFSEETGEPVANANVIGIFGSKNSSFTSENGSFTLGGFTEKCGSIAVDSEDYAPYESGMSISENNAYIEIPLSKGFTISGTVRNERSEPIACAEVCALYRTNTKFFYRKTLTDSKGQYRIIGIKKGGYPISVIEPEHEEYAEYIILDGNTTKDFVLKKGISITGKVLNTKGESLANATVILRYNKSDQNLNTVLSFREHTSDDGTFHISRCRAGKAEIRAIGTGYLRTEKEIEISETGNTGIEIVLERLCAIYGRIIDESGNPVCGDAISLYVIDNNGWHSGKIFDPGENDGCNKDNFEFTAVHGKYFILVESKGFITEKSDEIELAREGDTANCTIILKKGLSISGIVIDETGAPIPGAQMRIYQPGCDFSSNCKSDNEGAFNYSGLVEGTCTIDVSDKDEFYLEKNVYANAGDDGIKIIMKRTGNLALNIRGYKFDDTQPGGHASVNLNTARRGYGKWISFKINNDVYKDTESYPPGKYKLRISVHGYEDFVEEEVIIRAGETTELNIYLVPSSGEK